MKNKVAYVLLSFCLSANSQSIQWLEFDKVLFDKALAENKPVLLDLGATWCHWCHVMGDSTYSNKEVVDYLSRNFICAKANQDKRPDLYSKYKEYGWPATIVFDANANELLKYAGYANPREFLRLLKSSVNEVGKEQPATQISKPAVEGKWSDTLKQFIENDFYSFLDLKKGGFLMYQKFIDYDSFEYALLHSQKDARLKNWLSLSISNSANLNDKAWGGVYQYSTGKDWNYPHFEKLLSVQARYLKIYSKYFLATKNPQSLIMANRTVDYIDRFLKTKTGLYYNSQDADLKEGEHGGDYFLLADKQRMQKGVPRIDSSCYLRENALIAESFIYLWAAKQDTTFLNRAERILQQLIATYYIPALGYGHDKNEKQSIALADYIALCRSLILHYTASGEKWCIDKANEIAKSIIRNFNGEHGFVNYKSNSNPLPPNAVLAENIDLCRVFNRLYYYTQDNDYKLMANKIFSYLVSESVLKEIIAESGILTAEQELAKEPLKIVVFLKSGHQTAWENSLLKLWYSNSDYFIIERIVGNSVVEKYKDMKEAAGDSNCAFICSSKSCSSPFFNAVDLEKYLAAKAK